MAAVFSGKTGVDLEKLLIRSVSNTNIPAAAGEYKINGSVIHIWQIYRRDGSQDVVVEPMVLSPGVTFNENRSYIVLHTFGPVPILPGIESTYSAVASLSLNAVETCAPRGLSSRIADHPDYDLYLWIGSKSVASIKSVALGKTFQLNTSLSAVASRIDQSLHLYLINSLALQPLKIGGTEVDVLVMPILARNCHVFARITYLMSEPAPVVTRGRSPSFTTRPGAQPAAVVEFEKSSARQLPARVPSIAKTVSSTTATPPKVPSFKSTASSGSKIVATPSPDKKPSPMRKLPSIGARMLGPQIALPKVEEIVKEDPSPPPTPKVNLSIPLKKFQLPSLQGKADSPFALDLGQVFEGVNEGVIDHGEADRKQRKLDFFAKQCSKISDRLFLGSDIVARDLEILTSNGVSHVLNSAGVICGNYHESGESLRYKTYFLNDGQYEDIECIFHDAIQFIHDALAANQTNGVYVHCFQGVSRSATLVIAYLMVANKWSYDKAYQHTKAKRGIVEPNTGFMIKLKEFEKRLTNGPVYPILYRIEPHKAQTPDFLVARMVPDSTKSPRKIWKTVQSSSLDQSKCFVIHDPSGTIYLWKGALSSSQSFTIAKIHADRLIKFENGKELVIMEEGSETSTFWKVFEDGGSLFKGGRTVRSEPPVVEVSIARSRKLSEMKEEDDKEDGERESREPKMFVFPDGDELTLFDTDDLVSDGAFIVHDTRGVVSKNVFFWIGSDSHLAGTPRSELVSQGSEFFSKLNPPADSRRVVVILEEDEDSPDDFWEMFVCG